jgi:hypothetical protein
LKMLFSLLGFKNDVMANLPILWAVDSPGIMSCSALNDTTDLLLCLLSSTLSSVSSSDEESPSSSL